MKRPDLEKSPPLSRQVNSDYLWNDNIPIGMAILSEKSGFVRVNRALCRFLGYSKKELIGKTVRDITHPDEWANTATKIRKLHSGGQPHKGTCATLILPRGKPQK